MGFNVRTGLNGVCPVCMSADIRKNIRPMKRVQNRLFRYHACNKCGSEITAIYQVIKGQAPVFITARAEDNTNPVLNRIDEKFTGAAWETYEEFDALVKSFTDEEVEEMKKFLDARILERWQIMRNDRKSVIEVFSALLYL